MSEIEVKEVAKRLSKAEWSEIALDVQFARKTIDEAAKHYDIKPDTVLKKMRSMGVKYGSSTAKVVQDAHKKAEDEVFKRVMTDAEKHSEQIKTHKDSVTQMMDIYKKLGMAEIKQAKESGMPLATAKPNLDAIKMFGSILKEWDDITRRNLGIDKMEAFQEEIEEFHVRPLFTEHTNLSEIEREVMEDVWAAQQGKIPPSRLKQSADAIGEIAGNANDFLDGI